MGCCLSKRTNPSHPPLSSNVKPETSQPEIESKKPQISPIQLENINKKSAAAEAEKKEGEDSLEQEQKKPSSEQLKGKEEFVIKPRKSHDKRSDPNGLRSDTSEPESNNNNPQTLSSNIMAMAANGAVVRTSSCTKEEVDAILIQCGRLSRSSSAKRGSSGSSSKYSGSKRSHDFDKENSNNNNNNNVSFELNCEENEDDERQRRRQSRGSHRRTTPSRSRERDPQAQKSGAGGRRLSKSPGRRQEISNNNNPTATNSNGGSSSRPGKLVSVPATVSVEKSNNGGSGGGNSSSGNNVKRVLVRRNVGEGLSGSRASTPPRSRSPARSALVGSNSLKSANQNQQPSPNRNSSRKAEHSPYRRTPLTDLDMNSLPFQPLGNKSTSIKGQQKIRENNVEASVKQQPLSSVSQNKLGVVQGTHRRARSRGGEGGSDVAQFLNAEQLKANDAVPTLTRTRSSRRSRDLDVESLSNPNGATNYTCLLLQDIQNFHQKGSNTISTSALKLPECVSKACSIVEAVADLNLNSSSIRPVGRGVNGGDEDDLMEPSLHKFVTVVGKKKKGIVDRELDEQQQEESSGSNSIGVGSGQNQWVSSSASSWEPGSEGASQESSQLRSGVVARSKAGIGR